MIISGAEKHILSYRVDAGNIFYTKGLMYDETADPGDFRRFAAVRVHRAGLYGTP